MYVLLIHILLIYDCFHTTAKCVFWILIWDAHFELKFKIRILNKNSKYAFWIKIQNTQNMPNHVAKRNLKCASQITVQRCFPVTILANHATKSVYERLDLRIVFWGAELVWPSNHFHLQYRALHMQRKRKQHTCMFDWQATQTQPCLFSTLSKGESHFRSLVCIMRNSKKCAFRIKIQNTHFAVVWKQSKWWIIKEYVFVFYFTVEHYILMIYTKKYKCTSESWIDIRCLKGSIPNALGRWTNIWT